MKTTTVSVYQDILNQVAIETGQSKEVVSMMVGMFLEGVKKELLSGKKILLRNFGFLEVTQHRTGSPVEGLNEVVCRTRFRSSKNWRKTLSMEKENIRKAKEAMEKDPKRIKQLEHLERIRLPHFRKQMPS